MTTTDAEQAALDAWAKAQTDRNVEALFLAQTLLAFVKAGTVTLPDYLASRVADFAQRCAAANDAQAAYIAARDAANAEAVQR